MATATAIPPRPSARAVAGGGAALAAGLLGFLLAQSLILTRADPARALRLWPWNAAARAEQATALLAGAQDPTTAARARALSVAALRDQPLLVPALRALALAQASEGQGAARTMAFAETLSRRDLPTELWLIEVKVARGDIVGALVHYDRALRTSDAAPDLLLPVLVGAAADPAVARPLAALVARRPLWWRDFAERLIQTNPSSAGTATIVAALRLDPSVAEERALLSAAMTRLADAGRADLAVRLAPNRSDGALRRGGFEGEPGVPPFDWRLAQEGDLGAAVEARGEGNALFLDARGGRGGEVARRLLTLAPGRYRLRGTVGDVAVASEAPALFLTCAGQNRPLTRFRTPAAPAGGARFAGAFAVPRGCPGQWLIVEATSPLDVSDRRPWLDDLAIASE